MHVDTNVHPEQYNRYRASILPADPHAFVGVYNALRTIVLNNGSCDQRSRLCRATLDPSPYYPEFEVVDDTGVEVSKVAHVEVNDLTVDAQFFLPTSNLLQSFGIVGVVRVASVPPTPLDGVWVLSQEDGRQWIIDHEEGGVMTHEEMTTMATTSQNAC